jgi:quercetin dioxygenase-like cupin family protein
MHKPESAEDGISYDLMALERELRVEEQYARSGHMARTLTRASDQRTVLMVMKSGARIAEHQADGTASIQVLAGRVRFGLPSRTVEMTSGELLVLAPGLRHQVEASEDSTLLLTLGWSSKASAPSPP